MKPLVLILLAITGIENAQAGPTRLNCASESNKVVVSGLLPGPGEAGLRINFSAGNSTMIYANGFENQISARVRLDARLQEVSVDVIDGDHRFILESAGKNLANLAYEEDGVTGSFVGLLSGTDPVTRYKMKNAIRLRCLLTFDE